MVFKSKRKTSLMFRVLLIGILIVGVVGVIGAVMVQSFAGPSSQRSSFDRSNPRFDGSNYQYQSPSFNSFYSSSQISEYWPILRDIENDQCEATSDFVVAIPPLGCTPTVVRSDLLEEQNVPIFCKLDAVQVNPLIKVSSIKSISFKGDYPNDIAGISFHPARAAVKSYKTLLGSPLLNNIGYIVIVLKQNRVEDNMPDWVGGNLTATVYYDADEAYGTGQGEYYVPALSEKEWKKDYEDYGFWYGRGFVRVLGVSEGIARIGLYTGVDGKFREIEIEEGKTSNLIYFPGFYCKAGLKIKLNKIVAPEKQAKLNVDGSDIWVRKGSKILNNRCTVRQINIFKDAIKTGDDAIKTGDVIVSCPGKRLNLTLKKGDGEVKDASQINTLIDYHKDMNDTIEELIDVFPSEKRKNGDTYGETALFEQIELTKKLGMHKTRKGLIGKFLDKYPNSALANRLHDELRKLGIYNYTNAVASFYVNNEYHSISVEDFKDIEEKEKKVTLVVGSSSYDKKENEEIINGDHKFIINKIEPREVKIDYYYKNKKKLTRTIKLDDDYSFKSGGSDSSGRNVRVSDIDVEEVAYISLIPEVKNAKTEANFTFKVGIEKRGIELSPEKAREMIRNLNDTIEKWSSVNEKLGKLVKGWKGACFATSTLLMFKNMADGFSGKSLARSKVMEKYRDICATEPEYKSMTRTQCYNALASKINTDVDEYAKLMQAVNKKMDVSVNKFKTDGNDIPDQKKYVEDLRNNFDDKIFFDENGKLVIGKKKQGGAISFNKGDIDTSSQARTWLMWKEAQASSSEIAKEVARAELEAGWHGALITKQADVVTNSVKTKTGLEIPFRDYRVASEVYWDGTEANVKSSEIAKGTMIQGIWHTDGKRYVVALKKDEKDLVVDKIYSVSGDGSLSLVSDKKKFNEINSKYKFKTGGDCSYAFKSGTAKVRYYETGKNKWWPAIVPFDLQKGWYAMVPPSAGTFVEGVQGYKASGDVNYFKICNIGPNRLEENGKPDDLCQSFDINTYANVKDFLPCPSLSPKDVQQLATKARAAIREAQSQYGQSSINIFGEVIDLGTPMTDTGDVDCQDFMTPEDCQWLFNVCDPVICPASRCDLGGKFRVADVVQTGILGSIALCLPNAQEGILVPICLTGIHAGIDSLVSIMKSERKCLQHSIDTGEHVGICDEITSVYMCEFFWRQVAPFMDLLVPRIIEIAYGGGNQGTRGGGEYLTITHAWNNLQKSVDFFKNNYAQNAFRAFQYRNVEEAGGEFCRAFVGTSFPTSAEALDSLLEPESPSQFYARFDETSFTEATVPASSHYKVYYRIYAGNDRGAYYQVWLKNPPASSYYKTNPTVVVKTGYIAKGESADETIDFTAPEGYKELCVRINEQEECGFKQVTSDFGINYVRQKYVEEQAEAQDITSEEECISGTRSNWPLISPNLQEGVSEAVQPEIALRGIVRICATANPGQGVGATERNCQDNAECIREYGQGWKCEFGNCVSKQTAETNVENKKVTAGKGYITRWKDVGYCDDPNVVCWLDTESVEDDLKDVAAIEDKTISTLLDESKEMTEKVRKLEEDIAGWLSKQRENTENLRANPDLRQGVLAGKNNLRKYIDSIIEDILDGDEGLNNIIGVGDIIPQGSNNQKAEAYYLKAKVYGIVVDVLSFLKVDRTGADDIKNQPVDEDDDEDETVNVGDLEEEPEEIFFKGDIIGVRIDTTIYYLKYDSIGWNFWNPKWFLSTDKQNWVEVPPNNIKFKSLANMNLEDGVKELKSEGYPLNKEGEFADESEEEEFLDPGTGWLTSDCDVGFFKKDLLDISSKFVEIKGTGTFGWAPRNFKYYLEISKLDLCGEGAYVNPTLVIESTNDEKSFKKIEEDGRYLIAYVKKSSLDIRDDKEDFVCVEVDSKVKFKAEVVGVSEGHSPVSSSFILGDGEVIEEICFKYEKKSS